MSLLSLIQANSRTSTFGSSSSTGTKQSASTADTSSVGAGSSKGSKSPSAPAASSDTHISLAATIAANEASDNKRNYTDLEASVRSNFDAQYQTAGTTKSAKHNSPDVSEISGRALAVIALNKDSKFSPQEVLTAKTELNTRERTDLMNSVGAKTGNIAGVAAYTKQMISTYNAISPEERQARGWTQGTIGQATHNLQAIGKLAAAQGSRSLFDDLSSSDSASGSSTSSLFDLL